jgi:CDP-glycerol glycerophosphotransferase
MRPSRCSSNLTFIGQKQNLLAMNFVVDDLQSSYVLRVVRRSDMKTLEIACQSSGREVECIFPEHVVLDVGRWDLWLRPADGIDIQCVRIVGEPDTQTERHFYCAIFADLALSAYLTDSEHSLALFVAPIAIHAQVRSVENAKHAYSHHLLNLPVQEDLVLFESFLGKAYAGNPRYIYEELLRSRPDLRCVWAYNGKNLIPGDPQVVTRGSAEYYRLLAQAKYRVNNIRFPVNGRKDETVYLQTWHGTPLKCLSFDIEVSGPEVEARDSLYLESRAWSFLLSENHYSSEILPRAFRYNGKVLEMGYPLTDVLLDSSIDRDAEVRALGLPEGKRFILYAPTWRDNKAIAAWQHEFDLNLDFAVIADGLPADCILLIKAHHLVSEKLDRASLPGNVVDMSHVEDINDLCLVADALVTDYSSVFFDFAVTGRPVLFYCYDLDVYAMETRGLYMDVHTELPGPIIRTTAELVRELADIDSLRARYAERYRVFQRRFCSLNDGQAARRVVAEVFGSCHAD